MGNSFREQIANETKNKIESLATQKRLEEHKLSLFNEFLNSFVNTGFLNKYRF